MTGTNDPHDTADDQGPPPLGWVSVDELGQQIMLEQLSRSTARALIEVLLAMNLQGAIGVAGLIVTVVGVITATGAPTPPTQ